MITLLLALGVGSGFLGLSILFQQQRRKARASLLNELELRPNCLLTRHPLVLIAGRSSVFRLFDHWNSIPGFLREHGYEVLILEPVALIGHSTGSAASLIAALDDLPEHSHLIGTACSRAELEAIANSKHPKVATLTLVENPARRRWVPGWLAHTFSGPVSDLVFGGRALTSAHLKPFAKALESFELKPMPRQFSFANMTALIILDAHNFLSFVRGHGSIDPLEVAELETAHPWYVENQYLDLAIQIAERDYTVERRAFESPRPRERFAEASGTL